MGKTRERRGRSLSGAVEATLSDLDLKHRTRTASWNYGFDVNGADPLVYAKGMLYFSKMFQRIIYVNSYYFIAGPAKQEFCSAHMGAGGGTCDKVC